MKCVKIIKKTPDNQFELGKIIRMSELMAERLVSKGKAEYVNKALWKATGRERI